MSPSEIEEFIHFAAIFLNRDKESVRRDFISSFAPDEGLERAAIAFGSQKRLINKRRGT